MIYLDNAAATPPLPCTVEAMNAVLKSAWANPNSAHEMGSTAFRVLDEARRTVAKCMKCRPEEVHFTASASEAAARVAKTLYMNCYQITTPHWEHDAVFTAPSDYERRFTPKEYDNGLFQMLANNETGEIYDVAALRRDNPESLMAVDATAAVGHIPVDFAALGADYLFADAMKFGGVPGCAFLIVKEGAPLSDLMHRPTPPVALIAAMAAALEWHMDHMEEIASHTRFLFGNMFSLLENDLRSTLHINGGADLDHLPHIYSLRFDGVENTALAGLLSLDGVAVSTGAACSAGKDTPYRVLLASGLTEQQASETIRVSFSHENTLEEIQRAAEIITRCVTQLRTLSPERGDV